jgi:ribosomal protein S18 acetylase RimI-like enzyme
MPNFKSQTHFEFLVEPLQVDYLQAAIDLEREAGLGPTELTQLLERLRSPVALLLAALRQSDKTVPGVAGQVLPQKLIGLLTGWVVLDELEIESLVVAETMRRHGVGRVLLTEGLRLGQQRGATKAFLDVREDNLPALSLYRSLGFTVTGRRKNYYREPFQDALLLSLDLQNS